MTNKKTIKAAIEYLSIYATKSEKHNDFKFIDTSIDNPLHVSFIQQDKINSLLEHTGQKIVGTPEQRKKYFTSTSIQKMLGKMFINEGDKQATISADIDKQLRKNYCKNVDLFIEDDVAGFYSQDNKNYIYNPNGSCMAKKPISYFEIYDKFINTKAQIVGLKVGKSIVARAILWTKTLIHKKDVDQYDKKNNKTTFKVETHREKLYFLDRIYVSSGFQNSNAEELQNTLYNRIKRALKLKRLDCYTIAHIKRGQAQIVGEEANFFHSVSYPDFKIQINSDKFLELTNYPYMDSFRWGRNLGENISFDMDEENADYILESTAGYYEEGNRSCCDCCGEYCEDDYIHYSDIEEEHLCDECSIYIEERSDICRTENATYNNYTGDYHYANDLD